MVGWRDDPVHKKMSEAVSSAIQSGDSDKLEAIDREMAALAVPVPFPDWVDRGLAVHIRPHDYSNRELVLAIAQQFGSSHEDESVDEPLVQLQQFVIGGQRGDLAPLISFASTVIYVGRLFVQHLVSDYSYDPAYFKGEEL